MDIPFGPRKVYRPRRSVPRVPDAGAIRRMVRAARRAGESCARIKEVVREELIESGCEETTCDCERLYVLVSFGIAIAAAAIAIITKNRVAAMEARDAIARAMRSVKNAETRKELETADREIVTMDEDLAATEERWQQLLDRLRQAEENSFATTGKEGRVTIREDL